jgi:hypothetical protein
MPAVWKNSMIKKGAISKLFFAKGTHFYILIYEKTNGFINVYNTVDLYFLPANKAYPGFDKVGLPEKKSKPKNNRHYNIGWRHDRGQCWFWDRYAESKGSWRPQ